MHGRLLKDYRVRRPRFRVACGVTSPKYVRHCTVPLRWRCACLKVAPLWLSRDGCRRWRQQLRDCASLLLHARR